MAPRNGVRSGTRDGGRSGTKTTKVTKIPTSRLFVFVIFVAFVVFVSAREPSAILAREPSAVLSPGLAAAQQSEQPAQRPPVFRAGAHYVRVDAYPTTKDGRIVEGLSRDDSAVYEDGIPQAIETFEYIRFPAWTPEAERTDPRSLRSIKVTLKPKVPPAEPGRRAATEPEARTIRARRQYRAPTLAEIAAMSAAMSPPPKPVPPPPTLVAKPAAFVIRGRAVPQPADVMRLSRTERLRIEWEATGTLDQRMARVLDRPGKPLPVEVALAEQNGRVIVELPLAAFARGDYTVELMIGSGSIVERSPLAFRIQ